MNKNRVKREVGRGGIIIYQCSQKRSSMGLLSLWPDTHGSPALRICVYVCVCVHILRNVSCVHTQPCVQS